MKKSILLCTLFFSLPVLAHTDHSDTFFNAFYHPFSGWDHLLTMLIIGMMAYFSIETGCSFTNYLCTIV